MTEVEKRQASWLNRVVPGSMGKTPYITQVPRAATTTLLTQPGPWVNLDVSSIASYNSCRATNQDPASPSPSLRDRQNGRLEPKRKLWVGIPQPIEPVPVLPTCSSSPCARRHDTLLHNGTRNASSMPLMANPGTTVDFLGGFSSFFFFSSSCFYSFLSLFFKNIKTKFMSESNRCLAGCRLRGAWPMRSEDLEILTLVSTVGYRVSYAGSRCSKINPLFASLQIEWKDSSRQDCMALTVREGDTTTSTSHIQVLRGVNDCCDGLQKDGVGAGIEYAGKPHRPSSGPGPAGLPRLGCLPT